jgi:hypothetical protein
MFISQLTWMGLGNDRGPSLRRKSRFKVDRDFLFPEMNLWVRIALYIVAKCERLFHLLNSIQMIQLLEIKVFILCSSFGIIIVFKLVSKYYLTAFSIISKQLTIYSLSKLFVPTTVFRLM